MEDRTAEKAALRRRMRLLRDVIDDQVLRSVQLWASVAELPAYAAARRVMAYASIAGEPDTDGLHARLARDGKELVLPRMRGGAIEPALAGERLARGELGIAEPTGATVDPASIDLVIVPGVAFTLAGDRLGRGKGHYDRFLAGVSCPTVGVCFAEQVVDTLPTTTHDVRVGAVLAG
jgi:5-formyltetrahydrofolate cyclo-ligase